MDFAPRFDMGFSTKTCILAGTFAGWANDACRAIAASARSCANSFEPFILCGPFNIRALWY